MSALILLTWRECSRRAFLPVAGGLIVVTVVTSRLFLGFAFGAEETETTNLAISAVFAAGLLHAAFLGSAVIRNDAERGTFGLLLSKPLGLESYLSGRYLGLLASSLFFAICVAAMTCAVLYLMSSGAVSDHGHHHAPEEATEGLLGACFRALLPIPPLVAASLLFSAVVPGFAAPIALILLFAAGSLSGGGLAGLALPDFALFGLEAQAHPPSHPRMPPLMAYTGLFSCFFLLLAYIWLATRLPLRSEG